MVRQFAQPDNSAAMLLSDRHKLELLDGDSGLGKYTEIRPIGKGPRSNVETII